ncbi:MAG: hypothetical protein ACK55K_03535 [Bacteroidota bacterium]
MLSLIFDQKLLSDMRKTKALPIKLIFISIIMLALFSCSSSKKILNPAAPIDTLNIALDLRLSDQKEFKDSIQIKMQKFIDAYNLETHPFKLSLSGYNKTKTISIQVIKTKFISKKKSLWAAGITAAGLGTAGALIATGFVVPFGWVYIPNAKCAIVPGLSSDLSDIPSHQKVTLSSVGMFRPIEKQFSIQSRKLVKYVVEMVLQLEEEYKKTPR